MVLRLRGSRGLVGVKAAFQQHPMMEDNRKQNHYVREYKPEEIPLKVHTTASGCWLRLDGRFTTARGGFGAVAKVIARGRQAAIREAKVCWHDGPVVSAEDADDVLIVARAFKGLPTPAAVRAAKAAVERAGGSYDRLLARHGAAHRKLYRRVRLEISGEDPALAPAKSGEMANEALLAEAFQNRVSNCADRADV